MLRLERRWKAGFGDYWHAVRCPECGYTVGGSWNGFNQAVESWVLGVENFHRIAKINRKPR